MFTPSEFSIVFITTNRKQCVLHSLYRRSVRAGSRLVIFTNHVGFRFSVKSQLASVTSSRESRFGLSGADQGSLTPGDQLVCTLESTACHFLPPFLFLFFFCSSCTSRLQETRCPLRKPQPSPPASCKKDAHHFGCRAKTINPLLYHLDNYCCGRITAQQTVKLYLW